MNKTLNGPVHSLLQVKKIDNKLPLIIANCDQFLNWDVNDFIKFITNKKPDGCVLTYRSKNKKNSFVKTKKNIAIKFLEKKAISNHALIGVHYWKYTYDFFQSARKYVKKVNKKKEAYVSETYNYLVKKNKL